MIALPSRQPDRTRRGARRVVQPYWLSACVLVAVLLAVARTATAFAPLDKWCFVPTGCTLPPRDLVNKTEALQTAMFGKDAGKCGDGICNVVAGETCHSCPDDCGKCAISQPFTKCKNPNHFAITFDDGPSPLTENLVKTLNAAGVKATFFLIGNNAAKHPELWKAVKLAYDSGHDIGTHTYSHRSLGSSGRIDINPAVKKAMTVEEVRTELLMSDLVVEAAIGRRPRFVRLPYLEWQPLSVQAMDTYGYIPININVDSNDWRLQGPAAKPETVVAQFTKAFEDAKKWDKSFISLQHDTLAHSTAAEADIIKFLKTQNVEFVPMRTCLGLDPYRAPNANPFLNDRFSKLPIIGGGNSTSTNSTDSSVVPDVSSSSSSSGGSVQSDKPAGQNLQSSAPARTTLRADAVMLLVAALVVAMVAL
ncbi:hypothetical protein AMAG_13924 [Allomyces macrogynus ATCC 38327]|uniref:NodB homology domain-containing protein n=1 Tax=Allomyces macrogynus (strain ATCC 38327) TaxID=578462 RepID=A0A0L0T2J2_ALLM3|nr:hypothetical protein AMAG_13924 [Allomyces macrogynus ATCC 38327]|eukprot:KNE69053.1 hypothetical protein AMAG_13924 [Allomyces macrogynus ATCC 38327]